jgi:hypothetical protein
LVTGGVIALWEKMNALRDSVNAGLPSGRTRATALAVPGLSAPGKLAMMRAANGDDARVVER